MCLFFLRCSFCPALKVMSQVLHLSQNVAISSYTSYHLVIHHRLCAWVGVVCVSYAKIYDFLHTHRHFVGSRIVHTVHIDA